MKAIYSNYGRLVIPKKGLDKNAAFKTILETQGIEMTEAEQALVKQYIQGEITKEAFEEAMMNLPIED